VAAAQARTSLGFYTYNARLFASKIQNIPTLGDSISDGVVLAFIKKPGDFVNADEPIAKIETDKVTVDILAAHTGVITKYLA